MLQKFHPGARNEVSSLTTDTHHAVLSGIDALNIPNDASGGRMLAEERCVAARPQPSGR